jgi:hypothetical protein
MTAEAREAIARPSSVLDYRYLSTLPIPLIP